MIGLSLSSYFPGPLSSSQHPILTSPLAKSVFILSRKLESSMLDSSKMKTIFSSLQPERRSTVRMSSSKSAAVYLRWTYRDGWKNTETSERTMNKEENGLEQLIKMQLKTKPNACNYLSTHNVPMILLTNTKHLTILTFIW